MEAHVAEESRSLISQRIKDEVRARFPESNWHQRSALYNSVYWWFKRRGTLGQASLADYPWHVIDIAQIPRQKGTDSTPVFLELRIREAAPNLPLDEVRRIKAGCMKLLYRGDMTLVQLLETPEWKAFEARHQGGE